MEYDEVLVVAKCSQEGGAFDMKLSLSYYRSRQECVTAALEAMEPDPRNKLHVWAPEVTVLAGFDEVCTSQGRRHRTWARRQVPWERLRRRESH